MSGFSSHSFWMSSGMLAVFGTILVFFFNKNRTLSSYLCLMLSAYLLLYMYKDVTNRSTINELQTNIVALKMDLHQAKMNMDSYQQVASVADTKTKDISALLEKCYSDLDSAHQAQTVIDEIMEQKSNEIDKQPYTPISNSTRRSGLQFVNQQMERVSKN